MFWLLIFGLYATCVAFAKPVVVYLHPKNSVISH